MVETKESILQYLTSNKTILFEKFNLTKLGLIGSFAKNEATAASDVDILVEFKPMTEDLFSKKEDMRELFRNQFEREIDICREKYIKPRIKNRILMEAIYV